MHQNLSFSILGACVVFVASCAPNAKLLSEPMRQEIAAGRVERMKLYVDADGDVVKRSLYVTPAAVPAWVVGFADEKIGPGAKQYFELEWYAEKPNERVYEVTRTIRGAKVEVSVNEHRELRYIEKEISASSLPAKVRHAVGTLSGFRPVEYEEKKGPGIHEYQVEGMVRGAEITYTYDPNGVLLRKQRTVSAELEVTTP